MQYFGLTMQFERRTVLLADVHLLSNGSSMGSTIDILAELQGEFFHLQVPLLPADTRRTTSTSFPLSTEFGNILRPAALSCTLNLIAVVLGSQQEALSAM